MLSHYQQALLLKDSRVNCAWRCIRVFPASKQWSTVKNCFLRLLRQKSCTMLQTAGEQGMVETGSPGEPCATEFICASLFIQDSLYLTLLSSCGKHLNHSRDCRDLQPQSWGMGQPVQLGTGGPVTTQLLYSIICLYFIFVFLQYNRIQFILHNVYKLYHSALQSKAWITWWKLGEKWQGRLLCQAPSFFPISGDLPGYSQSSGKLPPN